MRAHRLIATRKHSRRGGCRSYEGRSIRIYSYSSPDRGRSIFDAMHCSPSPPYPFSFSLPLSSYLSRLFCSILFISVGKRGGPQPLGPSGAPGHTVLARMLIEVAGRGGAERTEHGHNYDAPRSVFAPLLRLLRLLPLLQPPYPQRGREGSRMRSLKCMRTRGTERGAGEPRDSM